MAFPGSARLLQLVVAGTLLLAGCARQGGPPEPAGTASAAGSGKKLRIAVIPKGTTHDFWKSVHAGAARAADELGVEIIWKGTASEKDKEGQIKLVESFIVERVDGICLAPIDRTALIRPVRRAKEKGIPTVIFDSGLESQEHVVSYVATDNYRGGVLAAEELGRLLGGQGNVILLRYAAGSESTEQREQGFLDTLASKFPDIQVLSENQRVGSDATLALETSSSLLVEFGDRVHGVFTVCEPNNKGMLIALQNKKLAGKVKFVGFDSAPEFVRALREGTMHGVVLQDPVTMGYEAVKAMVRHLRGEQVEKRIPTGEFLATPENMDEPELKRVLEPAQFGA